jgi:DNA-binding transcriptional regulator YiaG
MQQHHRRHSEARRVRPPLVKVPQAAEARAKVGLSQHEFARLPGVSPRILQDWEQGRREPTGAAKTLLWITRWRIRRCCSSGKSEFGTTAYPAIGARRAGISGNHLHADA